MLRHFLVTGLISGMSSAAASATPITINITNPSAWVTFGGVNQQNVDLDILVFADTDNFLTDSLPFTSDGYAGVALTYSSVALGLAGVTGTELWDFTYALFGGVQESFLLNDAGSDNGQGLLGFGGALVAWNGVSNLAPIGPPTGHVTNSAGMPTDVIGGTAFVLNAFGNDATISATVVGVSVTNVS